MPASVTETDSEDEGEQRIPLEDLPPKANKDLTYADTHPETEEPLCYSV